MPTRPGWLATRYGRRLVGTADRGLTVACPEGVAEFAVCGGADLALEQAGLGGKALKLLDQRDVRRVEVPEHKHVVVVVALALPLHAGSVTGWGGNVGEFFPRRKQRCWARGAGEGGVSPRRRTRYR